MGVSGSELEALKAVKEEGGRTTIQAVSRKMRIDTNYARLLCTSLARADYLDLLASGILVLTPKGKRELEGRKGEQRLG
ncbi:hypothetical protein HKBW3S03_00443 [Candidatus Hakubella thermalkaliphila]|uniref:Uncharacterized protein n=1 Tax=Candidatus Hakubella thermalkaliphila TaxID=2754717 RepID=A0A6V8NM31_9ACTN|nr:hypothetical protein [Candidatus Hakubella thermalkaliphila]MBT9169742.1 hypothetical protein [Actinomycetota bacterium]GFP18939.1 hypothetical protein HKBW3S03_00443 [Candidatus Hakubella thermalkaliphila]GFP21348.1 hypothetical protein HKBW3S06_00574 [Candidatus Hakubella thermalkaliphila]GFP30519.1 hypothetical protein HKBW3S34_01439 [Candidatus Hakubella thermalkaliphila]GFP39012.1 hypothetical protein HKBW3S47_00712 [Candidatus Hakubella thermalkaliphila]